MTSLINQTGFKNSPYTGLRQEISWQTIAGQREKNIQMNENKNMAGQHRNGSESLTVQNTDLPCYSVYNLKETETH